MREKVAFVVIRYGLDINGGAEYHCRMLAEKLRLFYDVDVLTTCIKNYKTIENEYKEGVEVINGVTVRRFLANGGLGEKYKYSVTLIRKFRRLLYRINLLNVINKVFPHWSCKTKEQLRFYHKSGYNSPDLLDYLQNKQKDYKKIIFIIYTIPLTILGIEICKEKSILIPTAHSEGALFMPILESTFIKPSHIAFNTKAEQKMCKNIFAHMSTNSVIGVGVDDIQPSDWEIVKQKYQLGNIEYILYLGRIDEGKLGDLLTYFLRYKKKNLKNNIKLLLVGGLYTNKIIHEDIIYTGFVQDDEKAAFIQNAKVMINPSKYESLSLIVLEALKARIPILVNGKCDVLRDHVKLSKAGFYYDNYKQFECRLTELLLNEQLRIDMGLKGEKYVENNYDWETIIQKFHKIINDNGKK